MECKPCDPSVEQMRAIPDMIARLVETVSELEAVAGNLVSRLIATVPPEPNAGTTGAERPEAECPLAEEIAVQRDRIIATNLRLNDLCEKVQLGHS